MDALRTDRGRRPCTCLAVNTDPRKRRPEVCANPKAISTLLSIDGFLAVAQPPTNRGFHPPTGRTEQFGFFRRSKPRHHQDGQKIRVRPRLQFLDRFDTAQLFAKSHHLHQSASHLCNTALMQLSVTHTV